MSINPNKDRARSPSWWYFIVPAAGIFLVWVFWPHFLSWYIGNNNLNNWPTKGTMGDSFGALNTLFSGLAFSALAYTMWMQRSELAETREILRSQKLEAEEQNKTLKRQRFENTFFEMLKLHHQILNELVFYSNTSYFTDPETNETTVSESKKLRRGRNAIKEIFGQSKANVFFRRSTESSRQLLDLEMRQYFTNLYHVFKLIHDEYSNDPALQIEKLRYAKIARAQLSEMELLAIFYHCFWESIEFSKLAKEMELFEKLDESNFLAEEDKIGLREFKKTN